MGKLIEKLGKETLRSKVAAQLFIFRDTLSTDKKVLTSINYKKNNKLRFDHCDKKW